MLPKIRYTHESVLWCRTKDHTSVMHDALKCEFEYKVNLNLVLSSLHFRYAMFGHILLIFNKRIFF